MSRTVLVAASLLLSVVLLAAIGGCALFQPTEAVILVDTTSGTVPLTISFDGTNSTGADGISYYHWGFGTEDESTEATGTYTYQQAGTFTLRLMVRGQNGKTDTATLTIVVDPAIWITDENLDRVYKLDMDGTIITFFDLPAKEPRGVTLAEVGGGTSLVVACANEGIQRILYLDPVTGALEQELAAPGQSPLQITYGAVGQKQLWHVDGVSRKISRLNPADGYVFESYGQSYFKATSPEVRDVPFLRTPQGLDWTSSPPSLGRLWYLEGDTHLFYEIEMIAGYDVMSNTQLRIAGDPVELTDEIFPVVAVDIYDGYLWAIDIDRHRIVQIDLATGALTGTQITGFPGSAPSGLEIQH
ncbi:MAG: PKD domain-containing protein [Candidatus Bipolaricaulia bacterium]